MFGAGSIRYRIARDAAAALPELWRPLCQTAHVVLKSKNYRHTVGFHRIPRTSLTLRHTCHLSRQAWNSGEELTPYATLIEVPLARQLVVIPVGRSIDCLGVTECRSLKGDHRVERKGRGALVVVVHIHLHRGSVCMSERWTKGATWRDAVGGTWSPRYSSAHRLRMPAGERTYAWPSIDRTLTTSLCEVSSIFRGKWPRKKSSQGWPACRKRAARAAANGVKLGVNSTSSSNMSAR